MPAKDRYHEAFVRALVKDGWIITHDPLAIKVGEMDLFIDIGAERIVTAEREGERIAVEVKSFLGRSVVQDVKEALGQFVLYEDALRLAPRHTDRVLFIAAHEPAHTETFGTDVGRLVMAMRRIRLVIFDPVEEVITQWIR